MADFELCTRFPPSGGPLVTGVEGNKGFVEPFCCCRGCCGCCGVTGVEGPAPGDCGGSEVGAGDLLGGVGARWGGLNADAGTIAGFCGTFD